MTVAPWDTSTPANPQGQTGQFLCAPVNYQPGAASTYMLSASGMTALDTTNLAITFTAPASGSVLVWLSAYVSDTAAGNIWFGLINASGGAVVGPTREVMSSADGGKALNCDSPHYVTGLTPGTSYTLYFAACTSLSGSTIIAGSNGGSTSTLPTGGCAPATMTVQAV
jgi:hypothetical protein